MLRLFKPRLPVTKEDRLWVDASFVRLGSLLGTHRILNAPIIEPTQEHFPDPYDGSEEALRHLFARVAHAMQVDPESIDLTLFTSVDSVSRDLVPFGAKNSKGAGGLYYHEPEDRPHISVHESKLKDPMALVAVLAHEIGHIILLRPGLVERDEPDMEPLNDLLTVFLGLGIFSANSAFQFKQYTNNDKQGWSTQRLGYLPEPIWGYALARFAYEREEPSPRWAGHLAGNIAPYFKRSLAWLATNQAPRVLSRPLAS